jgi:glycosyltransferase involved in cell wall biosynthesis
MGTLNKKVKDEIEKLSNESGKRVPERERLTIDLHCHDRGSSEPDELMGRILGIPETWIESKDLITTLERHGCDTFTITNHNNARSCFDLLDQGYDILPGAEYSCTVQPYNVGIHVLAYGMTPEDDMKLLKLRSDIYRFLDYTVTRGIPTICAHPLYHYKSKGIPPVGFFDTLLLIFERFEAINGQRDSRQNIIVKSWIEGATQDKIDDAGKRLGINPRSFCKDPYRKSLSGGSDSHMGIFSGLTGSYLHVPGLADRLKKESRSALALEALRDGRVYPFGSYNDSEKMTITFIDYFCQIALHMEDPGLLRILLHKGDIREKALALVLSNVFGEMRRHKMTMGFLRVFHEAFTGKNPSIRERLLVKKEYRPAIAEITKMAATWKKNPHMAAGQFRQSLDTIFSTLASIAASRAKKRLSEKITARKIADIDPAKLLSMIELPSRVRNLAAGKKGNGEFSMASLSLSSFVDDLSFPVLGSAVLLAADFIGAKVMYNARPIVDEMAKRIGDFAQQKRALWLTDTFEDMNGVATVLREIHREIKKRNLPIDILVCSNNVASDKHLIVTKPVAEFTLPFYENQPIRIPDMMEIHRIFHDGEYDRVICSTEGAMGLASIYLKNAFTVPAHFYVHTDWMTFARKVLKLDHHGRSRLRRLLRTFYRRFDSLFVLNGEQRSWFTSSAMGFPRNRVRQTAHWVEPDFYRRSDRRTKLFGVRPDRTVVLFAGRVSEEKGVMELPAIMNALRERIPDVTLVVAGKGPEEKTLCGEIPDAVFLGWVPHNKLPEIYSSADILVLPSQFDTFGCVILEALACGLPAASYETKGPKEIIEHGRSGFLFSDRNAMISAVGTYLENREVHEMMRNAAVERAGFFSADRIINDLMNDLGLGPEKE